MDIIRNIVKTLNPPSNKMDGWLNVRSDRVRLRFYNNGKWVPIGENYVETYNYEDLITLVNNKELIEGGIYIIRNYTATTTQEGTRSAGHKFDIILLAISDCEFNENALARQSEDDPYFKDCNLAAWKLKYTIYNNKDKYAWADPINGKGVIYYLEDEYNNSACFDFKNIQFYKDRNWIESNINSAIDEPIEDSISYFYLFTLIINSDSIVDVSTVNTINMYMNEEYSRFAMGCYNNSIKNNIVEHNKEFIPDIFFVVENMEYEINNNTIANLCNFIYFIGIKFIDNNIIDSYEIVLQKSSNYNYIKGSYLIKLLWYSSNNTIVDSSYYNLSIADSYCNSLQPMIDRYENFYYISGTNCKFYYIMGTSIMGASNSIFENIDTKTYLDDITSEFPAFIDSSIIKNCDNLKFNCPTLSSNQTLKNLNITNIVDKTITIDDYNQEYVTEIKPIESKTIYL